MAMGVTVSVLLGAVVQVLWSLLYSWDLVTYWVWSDFVLVPARTSEPMFWHTLVSAGFLHSQGDMMHVLGNVVILALVGVPLEQQRNGGAADLGRFVESWVVYGQHEHYATTWHGARARSRSGVVWGGARRSHARRACVDLVAGRWRRRSARFMASVSHRCCHHNRIARQPPRTV